MNDADRREIALSKSALRCPACYMIQDCTLRDFRCTLARCPRKFVDIKPPAGSQPAVRAEGPS
jgi:hypothetical protein